jgi:hypothetical protein
LSGELRGYCFVQVNVYLQFESPAGEPVVFVVSAPVMTPLLYLVDTNVDRAGFASASHLVHEDEPSAFASAVLSFLSKRLAGASSSDQHQDLHPHRQFQIG